MEFSGGDLNDDDCNDGAKLTKPKHRGAMAADGLSSLRHNSSARCRISAAARSGKGMSIGPNPPIADECR
jgi:hypothetical protein